MKPEVIMGEGESNSAVITGNLEIDKVLVARIQNGGLESGDALLDIFTKYVIVKAPDANELHLHLELFA